MVGAESRVAVPRTAPMPQALPSREALLAAVKPSVDRCDARQLEAMEREEAAAEA